MSLRVEPWQGDEKPDAKALRMRLEREGYSVFEWSDAPGTVYGPHSHEEDQSHWIVSGELQLTVCQQTYVLRAGDRDFLPANTTHSALVPGNTPVRYLIGAKHSQGWTLNTE
jgi:quercetin dioxygenase-like cupin family protein